MNEERVHFDVDGVDWGKDAGGGGLVPAIVQDRRTLRVLMLGYVNREALEATLSTGLVTFYSRSKKRLWQKGEESGNVLRLRAVRPDCDKDALLILAEPEGPTCHTGMASCFGNDGGPSLATLADLAATIRSRREKSPPGSYTAKLFAEGLMRIAQKVGEEGMETALAAATGGATVAEETADLLYHLLVMLEATDTDWMEVMDVLQRRAVAGAKK